uniref:Uncharacterized protein n=1 Tax=Anguilla anguilla TaxID=7936 RepID=A0A0E9UEQ7_ANGAN
MHNALLVYLKFLLSFFGFYFPFGPWKHL